MKKSRFWFRLGIILAFLLVFGYSRLSVSKKRYISYLLRNLPHLPARYVV